MYAWRTYFLLCNYTGENSIVIISGANLLLTEDDVKAAKDIITSASVLICQLEIKPEVTQTALSIAKKAGGTFVLKILKIYWTQSAIIACLFWSVAIEQSFHARFLNSCKVLELEKNSRPGKLLKNF